MRTVSTRRPMRGMLNSMRIEPAKPATWLRSKSICFSQASLCAGRIATPVETDGGTLALGARASIVRCPWHKWEFEIATGRSLVDDRLRVRRYAVHLDDEHVVVTLDQPA